ncbi:hypothetical protein MVES_000962 [Malassezia vespertilionis]|uniref:Uncharacterized protein n=1 Tax=Malassezia vespertilionis TaxID=2020962 RepID=A0A2N1JFC0_9BASI|nr:hypothetical protein MVES_000962 [Malassezia vespertilionis]
MRLGKFACGKATRIVVDAVIVTVHVYPAAPFRPSKNGYEAKESNFDIQLLVKDRIG